VQRAHLSDHDRIVSLEQDEDDRESFEEEAKRTFTRILLWVIGTGITTVGAVVVAVLSRGH